MDDEYTTVRIPKEIGNLVDDLIESGFGFKSRAEVVKEAIRNYYLQLKKVKAENLPVTKD